MGGLVVVQGVVDLVGDPHQRQLAEGAEVAEAEVVAEGGVDLLGGVDVAVGHAAAQRLRRHVDQLDLVGAPGDLVGDRLALLHPGDALDDVVERLEVLDVERGDDVDAGVAELLDVLPALLVHASPGAFVWASSSTRATAGRSGDHGVRVHLLERRAAVRDRPPGDHLEALELRRGVGSTVRLHVARRRRRCRARAAACPR